MVLWCYQVDCLTPWLSYNAKCIECYFKSSQSHHFNNFQNVNVEFLDCEPLQCEKQSSTSTYSVSTSSFCQHKGSINIIKWRRGGILDSVGCFFFNMTLIETFVKRELQIFHQIGLMASPWGIFLVYDWYGSGGIPLPMDDSGLYKKDTQSQRESVSGFPPWPLLQFLPYFVSWILWLTSLHGRN